MKSQFPTMDIIQLTATTPLYVLSNQPVISKKTYHWLENIGVTNLEEMALAYAVEGKRTQFAALPPYMRKQIGLLAKDALQKVQTPATTLPEILLSIADQEYLQRIFNQRLKELRNRYVRNWFQTNSPSYTQVLPLFGLRYIDLLYKYGTAVEVAELYDLVQWFEMKYTEVIRATHHSTGTPAQIAACQTLGKEQHSFIEAFRKVHGHDPLLYILYHLLRRSDKRDHQIYIQLNGLNGQPAKDTKQIATVYQRTVTQIQNIVKSCQDWFCQDLMPNANWSAYEALFQRPYLTADDPLVKQIIQQELPDLSISQLFSLLLIAGSFKKAPFRNNEVLINPKHLSNSELYSAERWIKSKMRFLNCQVRTVPDKDLQYDETLTKHPVLKELMRYLLSKALNTQLSHEEFEKWLGKRPDPHVTDYLYDILKQNGKPMYYHELQAAYNEQHQENPVTSEISMRNYIRYGDRIKPIGRRSLYGLSEWEHVFYGTIADYVATILSQSNIPLTLPELWEKVQTVYPMSSKHSMENLIKTDTAQRFVKYSKQRIGLKNKVYPERYKPYTGQYVKTFEEYFDELKDYIHKHHDLPTSYSSKGRSLYNWFLEYRKGRMQLTNEQSKLMKELIDECEHYATKPNTSK